MSAGACVNHGLLIIYNCGDYTRGSFGCQAQNRGPWVGANFTRRMQRPTPVQRRERRRAQGGAWPCRSFCEIRQCRADLTWVIINLPECKSLFENLIDFREAQAYNFSHSVVCLCSRQPDMSLSGHEPFVEMPSSMSLSPHGLGGRLCATS